MGAVYLVRDIYLTGAEWALKELDTPALPEPDRDMNVALFKREAEILASLDHPGLPRVVDFFEEQSAGGVRYYLAMEFIPGQPLDEILTATARPLWPVEAIPIALQVTHVLEHLHKHNPPIVFRDLKPSNLILTPEGKIYFIDFGIARHHRAESKKDTQDLGTPGFCAPEQYGHGQTTPRSDIYAVGSTLYHMLSKTDPQSYNFKFPPLSSLRWKSADGQEHPIKAAPSLDKVLQRCLQLKPEDRYPDAASLRHDLELALRDTEEPVKGTRSLNPGLVALLHHPRTTAAQDRAALWAFWKDWLVRTFVQKPTQPRPPIHRGP